MVNLSDPRAFRRHMARFELGKARRLRAEGRPDRAAALARARLWRAWSVGASRHEAVVAWAGAAGAEVIDLKSKRA